ncbi:MAG: thiamine pyrophosphate-dependent enzyme [Oscillospiraceae bacterium]|nr:thiamine pyrophosphate-dependent enzyme [Oscillospiraceae bacterium]
MPKSQHVSPSEMRAPGFIHFTDIPVNQYSKTVEDEKKAGNFTDGDLIRIYRDIALLREFETMIRECKVKGLYNGVKHTYPGPSHLSIGQEATAVGQAYLLGQDDITFGSHRSHGEILAKGLSSIFKLGDDELTDIMKNFFGGLILNSVEKINKSGDVKELAVDFLLYGTASEIFGRETGFHRGLGGSMHAFFLPFGIFPNNAIVGGSAPIALGAALYKRVNQKKGIVIANAGDGSLGCGPVYESMNFAAMDQFTKLWDREHNGGLPILFNFNNNQYGMGGQTRGETMAYEFLARFGAGVNPAQMHAERVDGWNPLAVIDAMRRKKPILESGRGPVLLDLVTYRLTGHSTSDIMTYRTQEEFAEWEAQDPTVIFKQKLIEAKAGTENDFESLWENVRARMTKVCELAANVGDSPYIDLKKDKFFVEDLMFSNLKKPSMDPEREVCDMLTKKDENPRVVSIAGKKRYYKNEDGTPVPKAQLYNIRDAVFEALFDKYYEDPTLIAYGEDVRDWGGAFSCYRDLEKSVPYHRLFNSPISESAIVGSSVGYALCGGRAVPELMYCDFMGRAGDEIFNQLAKWQAMSAGILKMPVVLRVSVGAKYAAQHSQDWTSLAAHIPGLKVVFPVTPYDTKGLLAAALNGTDPVVFFESQRLYETGEMFYQSGVPKEGYEIEIGDPDVKREGGDITILTIGSTLYRALEAADILQDKYDIGAEVIDARSIVPFDYEKVLKSVKKTKKILLASDAPARGSILGDMARNITEMAFGDLAAAPVVVGAKNWITPPVEWDADYFPQAEWILDAINEKFLPLPGHAGTQNYSAPELLRIAKKGV